MSRRRVSETHFISRGNRCLLIELKTKENYHEASSENHNTSMTWRGSEDIGRDEARRAPGEPRLVSSAPHRRRGPARTWQQRPRAREAVGGRLRATRGAP